MGGICFFNTAKAWGGGEKWHFEVSGHLHAKGFNVFVVAHRDSVLLKKLMEAGIPCQGIEITNLSFLNPFKHISITKILKKGNFHSIVMNMSRDIKIAGPSAKRANIDRIIYRRGSAIPIKNTFLNRYYFKKVLTEILANSYATKRTILENNPDLFPENKITVIHNGIDIADVQHKLSRSDGTPNKEFTLLTLGRLEYQKNHEFLIHLSKALNELKLPHKIVIGGSGRLRERLEKLTKNLDVAKQVIFKGFIVDPLSFIQQADVFVLPSLWEGFGYVLAEASLCKKPIIAFDISSNPEVVVQKKTGFLVPINDLEAFRDKIQYLFQNPSRRKEMGEAGLEHIQQHFDKKKQLQKIEEYIVNDK